MSELIAKRSVQDFLTRLAQVLSLEPPIPEDPQDVAMLKEFCVVQGQSFDWNALPTGRQRVSQDL